MRILHYFLGFPPYRTGGLTRYALDLMLAQVADKHFVMALWPGEIQKIGANPRIKQHKSYKKINNFEIVNPLPVPLDEGIMDVFAFTQKCCKQNYLDFLIREKPDVIHFHTVMGLHKEFILSAKELGIRTVFTTHDYFGICPKVYLFRNGSWCDDDDDCKKCIACNKKALSIPKIIMMQSVLYRIVKDTKLIKYIRKKHKKKHFQEDSSEDLNCVKDEKKALEYKKLREYYLRMYEMMDVIHFNSTVSQRIYERYFNPKCSVLLSITHRGILKGRKCTHNHSDKLRILYLSPAKPYKGYNVLIDSLNQLWQEEKNFELHLFGEVPNILPYMVHVKDGYNQSDLKEIMENADVLVAPSVCYETFGFTVLEAISFNVPVIVSDNVGAKDIIGESGLVVKAGSTIELKEALKKAKSLKVCDDVQDWKEFVNYNYNIYRGEIE